MDPATKEIGALVLLFGGLKWTVDAFGKPIAAELVKKMMERDLFGYARKVLEQVREIREARSQVESDATRTPTLEPGLLIDILDAAATTDAPEIRLLWARLIDAGIEGTADRSALGWAKDMLKQLMPDDALALALVFDTIKHPRTIVGGDAGSGTLHRALRRLEARGLIDLRVEERTVGAYTDRLFEPNLGRLHEPLQLGRRPRARLTSRWWQLTPLGFDLVTVVRLEPLESYGPFDEQLAPLRADEDPGAAEAVGEPT